MNRIKDLIIQFCKFGAVGGLCFGIDYGLMIFLTETHIMHYFAHFQEIVLLLPQT